MKFIKLGYLTEAKIPLPPLPIQRHIAAVLDKAQRLIAIRREQIAVLDKLAKDLFIDMFGDPALNDMGWEVCCFAKCVSKINNGRSPKCLSRKAEISEVGILKLSAVTKGFYFDDENKAAPHIPFDEKIEIRLDDLLMTRKNTYELVGMCAYVLNTRNKLLLPDIIFRLNTTSRTNKIFLWQLMNFPSFRPNVTALAGGTAGSMPNISKERLMRLEVPCPPVNLQNEFAECILRIETQKARLSASLVELEKLYKSLTQRAFAGELFA